MNTNEQSNISASVVKTTGHINMTAENETFTLPLDGLIKTRENASPVLEEASLPPETEEAEEYIADSMTSSYKEILFEKESLEGEEHLRGEASSDNAICNSLEKTNFSLDIKRNALDRGRPNSLILASSSAEPLLLDSDLSLAPSNSDSFCWPSFNKIRPTTSDSQVSIDGSPSFSSEEGIQAYKRNAHCRLQRTDSNTSGLSELNGVVMREGDVISFVANDLQEKIRLSSPLSRRDTPSFPSSRVSTPSLYKQALAPQVPLVDAGALADLEAHAQRTAQELHQLMENLSGTVQSISSLTVDCMETYEQSICKSCDMVDGNIKSMYQLMAKCEEINHLMQPLNKVSQEIKEIKRLLDLFENIIEHKS